MFMYSYNIVNQYFVGVVSVLCGFVIYIVIKIKIEEWLDDIRMSRLSLKRYRHPSDENKEGSPIVLDSKAIEISDEESDVSESETNGMLETSSCDTQKKHVGNLQADVFNISTDSTGSEEESRSPVFKGPASVNSNPSLFNWNEQKPSTSTRRNNRKKKQDFVHDDSDSPHSSENQSNVEEETIPKGRIFDYFNKMSKRKIKREKIALEVEEESLQHELTVSGVKIKFPMKPYSCQTAVMFKLIKACIKGENCLLESPTGSGKTLALLCGVLAWQDHCAAEIRKTSATQVYEGFPKYDINDGSPTKKYCEAEKGNSACCSNEMGYGCNDDTEGEDCEDMQKVQKVPKVYYGSRTHKQIEQVIRELKKTAYKHKKMTILSSREHTCLQSSKKNKTELCNELLDPTKHIGCPYYNDNNKRAITSFPSLKRYGLESVWDIEDLVTVGQDYSICPYFAAKNLMVDADIIFCPYNYLVDPDIRESMQINLQNQIIILDEAHNIEDTCREVGSVELREDHLTSFATECESLAEQRAADSWTYHTLKTYNRRLVNFMKNVGLDGDSQSFGDISSSPYWTGEEMVELLNMHNLGQEAYADVIAAAKAALTDFAKSKEDSRLFPKDSNKPVISTNTKRIVEHLMVALQVIFSKNTSNDYRVCVMECTVSDTKTAEDNTWYSSRKNQQRVRSLKLLCMNPGVIFSSVAKSARSIILASGTLTPISSFQSELATEFVHILSASHVIPKEQVYATCVPRGPNGVSLKANYQSVNTWNFQDELGSILWDVCQTVPHGVLCFFSSYQVRDTQVTRWKNSSLWGKIEEVKQVFLEPRRGGDLTSIMKEYREVIEDTSKGPVGKINGALFLAVFRGKVAEGIDFSDEEARCVMTVGIPYAVRKDPVIDMKMKYNDANIQKGLLKGSEWYTIQAFRALNQALGRCVRHMNDWGAVLLVDDRFLLPDNTKYLPKWFKAMWIIQKQYDLKGELNKFVAAQKARDNDVK